MADAPEFPPVTAGTVEAHMRETAHGETFACGAEAFHEHTTDHSIPPRPDGTPAFGHTHSPPAADEGTTT